MVIELLFIMAKASLARIFDSTDIGKLVIRFLAFNVLNPDARKLITDRLILNKESLGVTFSDISKKIIKFYQNDYCRTNI